MKKTQRLKIRIYRFYIGLKLIMIELFKPFNSKDTSEIKLLSLAPKLLKKSDVQTYLDALNQGVGDNSIRNIALTGSYGSGKSSLLKTFQHYYEEKYKFLNISLASFQINGEEPEENQIELSIIQQIIYHVRASKIPDSRFKRIKNITPQYMLTFMLAFTAWSVSSLILYKFDYYKKLNPENWTYAINSIDKTAFLLFTIFFLGLTFLIKKLIRFFHNSKITKVNVKGEFEVNDVEKSVLNQYLDELLYFFERNHYEAVVIEDMDRFKNSMEVFTKLREINTLINNSQQRKNKQKIVFIYAIKDEIFTEENERTKFFDLIIPVIPVINKSNSNTKFFKKFNTLQKEDRPNRTLLDDISIYVDDMRQLNNIYNEYVIYRNNLPSKLSTDKLLTMIVYKNLNAEDFALLNKGEGKLIDFLNKKREFIRSEVQLIDDKIESLKSDILKIEQEKISSTKELRAIYIASLIELIPEAVAIIIGNDKVLFSEMIDEDKFNQIRNLGSNYTYRFVQTNQYTSNRNSNISFKNVEQNVDSNKKYIERLDIVNDKITSKVREISSRIEKFREEKQKINLLSISELLKRDVTKKHLSLSSKSDKLLSFSLNGGYLDEDYFDYISYFHEGGITKEDNDFLQSVKSGIASDYNFKLTKIKELIEKIDLRFFTVNEIFNFDLIEYLFKIKDTSESSLDINKKSDSIIKLFIDKPSDTFDFIVSYVENERNISHLFKALGEKWEGIWQFIYNDANKPIEEKNRFLFLILKNIDLKNLKKINKVESFVSHISNMEQALTFINQLNDQEKEYNLLLDFDFKIIDINYSNDKEEHLFKEVIETNSFKITANNINRILEYFNPAITTEKLMTKNFTSIMESKVESLISYVDTHIDDYVKDVFLDFEVSSDDEKWLTKLYNEMSGDIDIIERIILNTTTEITNLTNIDSFEVKRVLLKSSMTTITWSNICDFFGNKNESGLGEDLIDYLNIRDNYIVLKNDDSQTPIFNELSDSIVYYSDGLDIEALSHLLDKLDFSWEKLRIPDIGKDKLELFIENDKISFNQVNFSEIKAIDREYLVRFIEINFSEFLEHSENYELDESEQLKLLNSSKIDLKSKLSYVESLNEYSVVDSEPLGSKVLELICQNDFKSIKYSYILGLFGSSKSNEHKIKLLNKEIDNLSNTEIDSLISKLSGKYLRLRILRKRTEFKATTYNIDFLLKLERLKLISSAKIEDEKVKVVSRYS